MADAGWEMYMISVTFSSTHIPLGPYNLCIPQYHIATLGPEERPILEEGRRVLYSCPRPPTPCCLFFPIYLYCTIATLCYLSFPKYLCWTVATPCHLSFPTYLYCTIATLWYLSFPTYIQHITYTYFDLHFKFYFQKLTHCIMEPLYMSSVVKSKTIWINMKNKLVLSCAKFRNS